MDNNSKSLIKLASILKQIEKSLAKPLITKSQDGILELRYGTPSHEHYIFLYASKILSNLSACSTVIRNCHQIEAGVLFRIIFENTIKLEYYVSGISDNFEPDQESDQIVKEYFSDFVRPSNIAYKYPKFEKMRKKISRVKLNRIDNLMSITGEKFHGNEDKLQELLWDQYKFFGNFVHCKYPKQ